MPQNVQSVITEQVMSCLCRVNMQEYIRLYSYCEYKSSITNTPLVTKYWNKLYLCIYTTGHVEKKSPYYGHRHQKLNVPSMQYSEKQYWHI